jgi:hypothetical protein
VSRIARSVVARRIMVRVEVCSGVCWGIVSPAYINYAGRILNKCTIVDIQFVVHLYVDLKESENK